MQNYLFIYLIDGNKIIEKKILQKKALYATGNYSYIKTKDELILKYLNKKNEIAVYNLNNLEFMFKLIMEGFLLQIYPFKEKYFIIFNEQNSKAIFKIYDINKMKYIQTIEVLSKVNGDNLFPISTDEYIYHNLIITIKEV